MIQSSRIARGCLGFVQGALENPVWGGLVARTAWELQEVGAAARADLVEDVREAVLQKRIAAISLPLGVSIVTGSVLQAMLSASAKLLVSADGPAAVVAILMALGVSRREATAIVRRVAESPIDANKLMRERNKKRGAVDI